jgi:SAM-dependent methyltransferase
VNREDFINYQIKNLISGVWALERPHGPYKCKFPNSFLKRLSTLIDFEDKKILHLFCGISQFGTVRVDINPAVKPDYVLDLSKDKLPFSDDTFDIVIADPPYVDFKPYSFVREAVRVLKPNGFFIVLHWLVYIKPKGCRRWACIAVSTGPNHRMRSCNIFRKGWREKL